MRIFIIIGLLFLGACNIIPDGALEDVPTSSTTIGLEYTFNEGSASATYEKVGDTYNITWNSIDGIVFKAQPNLPIRAEIVQNENRIESITVYDEFDILIEKFTFTYNLTKFSSIVYENLEGKRTDVFNYSLIGNLTSIERTFEPVSGPNSSGLIVDWGQGFVRIDPYDANEPGPNDGAFDNAGSINWENSLFLDSYSQGSWTISRGINGGDTEEIKSMSLTERKDIFTNRTTEMEVFQTSYNPNQTTFATEYYLSPLLLIPNDYFKANLPLLNLLYPEPEGETVLAQGVGYTQIYKYVQKYE